MNFLTKNFKYLLLGLVGLSAVVVTTIAFVGSKTDSTSHYTSCIPSDLDCIADQTLIKASEVGALRSLSLFVDYTKETDMKSEWCHNILHDVGKGFYKEFREGSYLDGKGLCYGAYYHGIILGAVEDEKPETPENLTKIVEKVCTSLHERNYTACMHGLGHVGYQYYDGNIDKAGELCTNLNQGWRLEYSCNSGLFMEIASNIVDREGNPESLENYDVSDCTDFKQENLAGACLIQVSTVRHTYGDGLHTVCVSLNEYWKDRCKIAYGSAAAQDLVPEWVESYDYNLGDARPGGVRTESIYRDCLEDTWCARGFYLMLGLSAKSEMDVTDLCDTFLKKYGNPVNRAECKRLAGSNYTIKEN